jgi:hypothetical protein
MPRFPLARPLAALALVAALVVAACTGGASGSPSSPASSAPSDAPSSGRPSVVPVPVSSELAVGVNRFVFSFLDEAGNVPVAAPDRTAGVRFGAADGTSVDADPVTFVWAIEDERGVYVTHVTFPSAGDWTPTFTTSAPGAPTETITYNSPLTVKADPSVIAVGEPAPSVDTPTADDVGGALEQLSTDAEPVAAFYETSVADALAAGEPFVLAFATPKFCATAQCGPTLDRLKPVAEAHPEVTFINVEPYELRFTDGQLQLADNQLTPVPAVGAYGLLSEPYIFVVDGDGIVRASFEAIFSSDEIEAAIGGLG